MPSKKDLDLQKDPSIEKKEKWRSSFDRKKEDRLKKNNDKEKYVGKSDDKLELIPAISIEDDKNNDVKAEKPINSQ
jgi:hypothetical protein